MYYWSLNDFFALDRTEVILNHRYACVSTSYLNRFDAVEAQVEISVVNGLPTIEMVGLCDSSVKESKQRVKSAIKQSGFSFPSARVTISISPSYEKKSGSSFDLPIALCLLAATNQITIPHGVRLFCMGELSLTGDIRPTPGMLARMSAIHDATVLAIIPEDTVKEAAIGGFHAFGARNLRQICRAFRCVAYEEKPSALRLYDTLKNEGLVLSSEYALPLSDFDNRQEDVMDISFLKGQEKAKRAIVLAAAGFHNLLLVGSPGSGKSTAMHLLSKLMPPMSNDERLRCLQIKGCAGVLSPRDLLDRNRPFVEVPQSCGMRQMHGDISSSSPGLVSLSQGGILFLDEIAEFPNRILDSLRTTIDEKEINSATSAQGDTSQRPILVSGAMNPCRCGRYLDEPEKCSCSIVGRQQYMNRISGAIYDRMDIFCEMYRVNIDGLKESLSYTSAHENDEYRERIGICWERQYQRCREQNRPMMLNGQVGNGHLGDMFRVAQSELDFLAEASDKLHISARGMGRILRVARTIADYQEEIDVQRSDISEALLYRDKK